MHSETNLSILGQLFISQFLDQSESCFYSLNQSELADKQSDIKMDRFVLPCVEGGLSLLFIELKRSGSRQTFYSALWKPLGKQEDIELKTIFLALRLIGCTKYDVPNFCVVIS